MQLCPQDSTFNYLGYVPRSRIGESFHRTPMVFLPFHFTPPFLLGEKSIISIAYRTEQSHKTTEGPSPLPPDHIRVHPFTLWRRRPLSPMTSIIWQVSNNLSERVTHTLELPRNRYGIHWPTQQHFTCWTVSQSWVVVESSSICLGTLLHSESLLADETSLA